MVMTLEEQAALITGVTTRPVRVAFIGAAGSGKTTHAKLTQKKYKGDVLSFATPLKKICRELFGEQMDDPAFARKALQVIGTDAIRAVDPMTWIRLLTAKVSDTRNCYVDDCRFPNEYYALRNLGFSFVRLDAHGETLHRRRPALTVEQAQHESEQHQLFFHADITVATDPPIDPEWLQRKFAEAIEEPPHTVYVREWLKIATDTEEEIAAVQSIIEQRLSHMGAL